ncbi:MAG: MBL fold metallo-hydrolase [Sphaerochaetaceae bacterium]|nr:MBL fold metallo-hydrolase [Sphaerochaetaceae bacterium]
MDLTFLGYQGSLQSAESSNTSYVLNSKGKLYLFDTSSSPCQELRKANLDPLNLEAIFLTHAHIDHIYALVSLLHNLWLLKRKEPIKILSNEATILKAKQLCALFEIEKKKGIFPIEFIVLEKNSTTKLNGLSFFSFEVEHGVETFGYAVKEENETMVSFSDCIYSKEIIEETKKCSILIHEAGGTHQDEKRLKKGGHSTAEQAALKAKSLEAGKLFLVHLPLSKEIQSSIEQEAKKIFPNAFIPELFKSYEV